MSTAFGIMDLSTKKLYDSIEELQEERIKELQENKDFKTLLKHNYIIPKELDELVILKTQSQFDKYLHHSLGLTIAPTLNCNMGCPYCYEKKRDVKMEENVRIALCDFVKYFLEINACKNFHVSWYGGEPLLEIEIIRDLSNSFIKLCSDKNINYSASIVTNGVLLTKEVGTILKEECYVKTVQITIDGLPEYHNNRRILLDGRNSFDIIVDNIENCKEILNIGVRVNVDKNNISNIEELTNYFIKDRKWINNPAFYISPVEKYNDNCYLKDSDCLSANEFTKLENQIIYNLYNVNAKDVLYRLFPQKLNNFCGAVRYGSYVVDPEGDLYTCWNIIRMKEKKIGNVIQKNPMNLEYMKWLTYDPFEKCKNCNIFPICHGGCPYEFIEHGEQKCDKRLQGFKDKLKFAYKDYIIKKNSQVNT